jgi:hypothetical protein
MKAGLPADFFNLSFPLTNISDTPKSTILSIPSFDNKRLSGLISNKRSLNSK